MSYIGIRNELQPYMGKQIMDAFNDIQEIALRYKLEINVIDPEFNTNSIDNDENRLNVRTDANSVITSFTIG